MSDDLIRRQDAIDVINRYSYYDDFEILLIEHENAVRGLLNLSSVDGKLDSPDAKQKALAALDNIFNYCEEIDCHLPDNEKTGYEMLSDYFIIRKYIMGT